MTEFSVWQARAEAAEAECETLRRRLVIAESQLNQARVRGPDDLVSVEWQRIAATYPGLWARWANVHPEMTEQARAAEIVEWSTMYAGMRGMVG